MSVLYLPHFQGQVPGMSSGSSPWVAEHPAVTFAGGAPVFARQPHAATWLGSYLDRHPEQPAPQVAALYEASTYHAVDGRTRLQLDLSQQRLREPHRQMVLTVTGQQPDPRMLAGCYHAAHTALAASAHGDTSQPEPTPQLVSGRYQMAFGHGYQTAYSNAAYALHTRVAATLGSSQRLPNRPQGPSELRDRCWRTQPPVPDPPSPANPLPADPADMTQAIRLGWAAGVALGGAHGALEAAGRLRAATHDRLARVPRHLRDDLDTVLCDALAATVPPWADRQLARHATGGSPVPAPATGVAGPAAAAFPARPRTCPAAPHPSPPATPAASNPHAPGPARPTPHQ